MTEVTLIVLVINCAVNIPLALTCIIGNTLVLYGVWKTPSLRSPSIILLCGLAVSDLAVGAAVQPLFMTQELMHLYSQSQRLKHVVLSVYNVFGYSLCGISLFTVAAISVDRLIAIRKSLQYASLVTFPRVTAILATIWITSLLLAALQFFHENVRAIAIGTIISVCLSVCTVSHVMIYRTARYHQRAIQIHVRAVVFNTGVVNNMSGLKRSALNSFIVFLVLFVCYCPYCVVYVVSSLYPINEFCARGLASTVVFMNSSLNPFVYCWRLREIREVVKQTCRKLVCCK